MSRRVVTKTYAKTKKIDYSALAFDEIFNSANIGPVKAASLNTKWGKTSFTSTRTLVLEKPNNLKRYIEADEDPFSFDSEISPKRHKTFEKVEKCNQINVSIFDKNRNISKNHYDEIPSDEEDFPKSKKFFTAKRTVPIKAVIKKKSRDINSIDTNVKISSYNIEDDNENERIWNSIVTDRKKDCTNNQGTNESENICFNIEKIRNIFQSKSSFEKKDIVSPQNEDPNDYIFLSKFSLENSNDEVNQSQPESSIGFVEEHNIIQEQQLRKSTTIDTCVQTNRKINRRLLNHRHGHVKRKFKYTHFTWDDQDEFQINNGIQRDEVNNCLEKKNSSSVSFDFPDDFESTDSSIKNPLTMIVRNVRPAHETQESGETQEFKDDVKYILDGIVKGQALSTRCLSAISLLNKCGLSSFRMYLRAHGVLDHVFVALEDAHRYQSLALCCSAIFLLMSSDRLSLDIDLKICDLLLKLCIMPNLNEYDREAKEFRTIQLKINSLFNQSDLVKRGQLRRHSLQLTTVSRLAIEALLKCAARKDIEFFRDKLKSLNGLDLIVNIVTKSTIKLIKLSSTCSDDISNDDSSDEIDADGEDTESLFALIEQCLEVLENMTFLNPINQEYLILYDSTSLTVTLNRLFNYCSKHLISLLNSATTDTSKILYHNNFLDLLLATLRLLLNLTNENDEGSSITGQQEGLIEEIFYCAVNLPAILPNQQRFNFVVLCLSLLVNLVENSRHNQQTLLNFKNTRHDDSINTSPLLLLARLFSNHFSAAKNVEDKGELDRSRFQKNNPTKPINIDIITNDSTLEKADKHMEDSIISAYLALLIGSILQNSSSMANDLRAHIPEGKFENLYFCLQKFLNFMNMTSGVRPACATSMMKILDVLASF